ncbi:MAG: L,D-transpeptidase family protein [Flavisolibacter sp.]
MKKIVLYGFTVLLLAACNNDDGQEGSGSKAESEKKVSKRDYSITKANSYSTLFFDSLEMEKFISEKNLEEKIGRRMRSFYNARNYQFAWFSKDGLTEQALGFWNLHDYAANYENDTTLKDKALQKRMEALISEENLAVSASASFTQTELTLTQHFIMYMLSNFEDGYVKRKEMERFIPFKKRDAMLYADSLLTKKHKDDKYYEDVHDRYRLLKEQLSKYYNIAKAGGWPQINSTKKSLKKGSNDPVVAMLKKRLQITGELPGTDTTALFNDTLEMAVKRAQSMFGYTPDGVVTADLIKDLNVTAGQRVKQILMNLGRMRWVPEEPSGRLILVNIPEFMLHMYEGKRKAFDMVVVVGKEGNNTMMFNGDLNQVVFSPHWNVPPSIVKEEILPAMANNPNYLSNENMEQTGMNGDLPIIRQKPGPGNALGQVKFLFPNSFNIYFHDTPSKSLFKRDKRAFSHGCIRLSEPEKMANYLLKDHSEWTPEKVYAAMNAGTEKFVKLKDPIPVVITYYTSWVDERGQLNFRDDVYDHDRKLMEKMFL